MSEGITERRCLVVLLRQQIAAALTTGWPFKKFVVDDTTFHDSGLGEWTGFYDWLRRSDREVIGVRYWPATANARLFETAQGLPYVSLGPKDSLEIYFTLDDLADPRQSADQEFQYDAVFCSSNAEWAIAFDIMALEESDLRRLNQIIDVWVSLRVADNL